MSNNAKIIIAVVVVIVVIILCCINLGKDSEETNNTVNTENVVENETVSNTSVENEITNNTVANEIVDEEPIVENVTEVKPQGTVYETNPDTGTTDKKQQAISLVKEKWGEDNTVTFRCDSVTSNGEYVIAVVSKETASVKNYFRVNLAAKTVEIDY